MSITYTLIEQQLPVDHSHIYVAIILIVIHFISSFSIYEIAKKLRTKHSWLSWIPLANIYLLLKFADYSGWWMAVLYAYIVEWIVISYTYLLGFEKTTIVLIMLQAFFTVRLAKEYINIFTIIGKKTHSNNPILLIIPGLNIIYLLYIGWMLRIERK